MICKRIVDISAVASDNITTAGATISYYSYEWEWRTQTSLPPPQKTFGSNNGAWAGGKSLYVSSVNQAGADVSGIFRQMKAGDTIKIENKTDATIWASCVLAVPPVDYIGFFTFPTASGDGQGAAVNNMIYKVTFSTGAVQTVTGAIVFGLLEDGSLARYNDVTGVWTYPVIPYDLSKGHARVISTTKLPSGFELIHNVYTQLWSWRRVGSTVVPPPAIEGEVGDVFNTDEEAINDAKQRHILQNIKNPTL